MKGKNKKGRNVTAKHSTMHLQAWSIFLHLRRIICKFQLAFTPISHNIKINQQVYTEDCSSRYGAMTCWETFGPGIHVGVTWHTSLTKTLSKTKNTQMAVASTNRTMHPETPKNCLGMAQRTWERAQGVAFLPPNPKYPNSIKNSSDFPKQVQSTMDGTWPWPIQAWTQDFWGRPVVSDTIASSGDPLSSVGYEVGPPWIGSSKSYWCSIGFGSGQAETWSSLLCSLSCSFTVFGCGRAPQSGSAVAIRGCTCSAEDVWLGGACHVMAHECLCYSRHLLVHSMLKLIGVHLAILSQLWSNLNLLQARDINT